MASRGHRGGDVRRGRRLTLIWACAAVTSLVAGVRVPAAAAADGALLRAAAARPAGEGGDRGASGGAASPESGALAPLGASTGSEAANAASTVGSDTRARDLSLPPATERPWQLSLDVQYRALAVVDDDPNGDRQVLVYGAGLYELLPRLSAFVRAGVQQRFVRVDDETGARLQDVNFGAFYLHDVSLDALGWQRDAHLLHRLRVYLPTSLTSRLEDLRAAFEWTSRVRVNLFDQVFAGLRGAAQYRWYEYAEQSGPAGGTLPQFWVEELAFLEYSPIVSPRYGVLTLGADGYVSQRREYAARSRESLTQAAQTAGAVVAGDGVITEAGAAHFSDPRYGFDLYAVYAPWPQLTLTASVEQGGSMLSNGGPHVYLLHRDQTEVALRAIATY